MKCGKGKKIQTSFFRICFNIYDYEVKASRYRKGLSYLKNSATTNQNQTNLSQKLKRGCKHELKGNNPIQKKKEEEEEERNKGETQNQLVNKV